MIYSVLEFVRKRFNRTIAKHFNDYTSVDIFTTFPDVKSSIIDFENSGKTFDLVCSFPVPWHNHGKRHRANCLCLNLRIDIYIYQSYSGAWFSIFFGQTPKLSFAKRFCRVFDGLGGSIDVAKLRIRPKEENI